MKARFITNFGIINRRLFGLFILLFVCTSFAQTEGNLTGADIMDKYVTAAGGKVAFESVKNRVTKGTMALPAQGISFDITTYQARPGYALTVLNSTATGEIRSGTDGKIAWENSAIRGPKVKKGKEKIDTIIESRFDKVENWRDVFEKAELRGEVEINGKECYKVELTVKDSNPRTLYFDKETGLLKKLEFVQESDMGTLQIESEFQDFKKVENILLPHKVVVKVLNQERVISIQNVEHNVNLEADLFKVPEEITALLEKKESQ